ncbi:MAG TPA: RNB domain-containing ribonuclease [Myxococcales bacterium]|nr:RNB domain-containing ribonuclease [Myxococcales bacterium]
MVSSLKEGRVIYVFSSTGWVPARVLNTRQDKVEVIQENGSNQLYAAKRLAFKSSQSVPTVEALKAYIEQVKALMSQIDMEAVWELLYEDKESEYDLDTLVELAVSPSSHAAVDATAWKLFQDSLYFRQRKDGRYSPNTPVSIDERRKKLHAEQRVRVVFESMLQWLKSPSELDSAGAKQAVSVLKELVLENDQSPGCKQARNLIRQAFPADSEIDVWIAWRILIKAGVWHSDENMALQREQLPLVFSSEVLQADAQRFEAPPDMSHYVDYCHLQSIAIDDAFTTEVDDALAIVERDNGERVVYVFIADAAAWVTEGDLMDQEAAHRGSTLYLPEGMVPMLPERTGQDLASLKPGQARGALAFIITLDAEGRRVGFEVQEALVKVDAQVTYEQTNRILDGEESPYADTLKKLAAASEQIRAHRREAGALILDRLEVSVHVHEGEVQVDSYRTDDRSRCLVSEWMIAACAATAEMCRESQIPAVFRGQVAPDPRPHIPPSRSLTPSELLRVLRTMRRAELSTSPSPHAGLGVPCYTQVTSPLRRYQDLVMHRQLKGYLRRGTAPWNEGKLMSVFETVEVTQQAHGRVERESRRYWLIKSLESRKGEQIEVEVLREAGRRFIVQILENRLQTAWSPDIKAEVGERHMLTLHSVNACKDRLVLG